MRSEATYRTELLIVQIRILYNRVLFCSCSTEHRFARSSSRHLRCHEYPLFYSFQPTQISNRQILNVVSKRKGSVHNKSETAALTCLAIHVERKQTKHCAQLSRRCTLNPSLFSTTCMIYNNRPYRSSFFRELVILHNFHCAAVPDYYNEDVTLKTIPDLLSTTSFLSSFPLYRSVM